MLQKGDKAPSFEGYNQDGNIVKLSDFKGKKLVLYFYPKDNTPACTAEACNLRDNYERFFSLGYVIIGISKDSKASHKRFIEKYSLPFPLISDPSAEILKTYDAWGKKKFMGKEVTGTLRKTYIIDEDGIIKDIIAEVNTKEHSAQILK